MLIPKKMLEIIFIAFRLLSIIPGLSFFFANMPNHMSTGSTLFYIQIIIIFIINLLTIDVNSFFEKIYKINFECWTFTSAKSDNFPATTKLAFPCYNDRHMIIGQTEWVWIWT